MFLGSHTPEIPMPCSQCASSNVCSKSVVCSTDHAHNELQWQVCEVHVCSEARGRLRGGHQGIKKLGSLSLTLQIEICWVVTWAFQMGHLLARLTQTTSVQGARVSSVEWPVHVRSVTVSLTPHLVVVGQ